MMKENKPYFPLFISLEEKRILLVGAGNIAARRAEVLLSFGAKLYIVSPECQTEMEALCKKDTQGNISYQKRCFEERDLDQMDMVIAATDNAVLNHEIVLLCRQKGILVGNASSKADCDFFFPAILREDGLTIGVSSGGNDHKKVAAVCETLRRLLLEMPHEILTGSAEK